MHTSLHSLAHRAPPATRTRVRWQPYGALPPLTSSVLPRSPPSSSYLNSPSSSVSSSPPPTSPSSSCDYDRLRPAISTQSQKDSKNKYALGLVDQAVKSLNDIWRPGVIPPIFLTSSRDDASAGADLVSSPTPSQLLKRICTRNTQLPSPVSPNTQLSPPDTSSPSLDGTTTASCNDQSDGSITAMFGPQYALVPIKGFVHEVLRRSRTSGGILQTALCYLEAVRPKIMQLAEEEKAGKGVQGDPEPASSIELASEADLERDLALDIGMSLDTIIDTDVCSDIMDTVRVCDTGVADSGDCDTIICDSSDTLKKPKGPSPPLEPLPPLPSPLLCPRRAFLAALILASKFAQDKCYSNRAWAKLSGLPPREIGRCERALGDALGWRLWVGKSSSSPQFTTPPAQPSAVEATTSHQGHRPISRCQSENDLRKPLPFFVQQDAVIKSGVRRCATLPADAFALKQTPPPPRTDVLGARRRSISRSDASMNSPQLDAEQLNSSEYPPTELIDPNPPTSFGSPCPETPGLSYSPSSSTESSFGDRTVQMSSFLDDSTMGSFSAASDSISQWGKVVSMAGVDRSCGDKLALCGADNIPDIVVDQPSGCIPSTDIESHYKLVADRRRNYGVDVGFWRRSYQQGVTVN